MTFKLNEMNIGDDNETLADILNELMQKVPPTKLPDDPITHHLPKHYTDHLSPILKTSGDTRWQDAHAFEIYIDVFNLVQALYAQDIDFNNYDDHATLVMASENYQVLEYTTASGRPLRQVLGYNFPNMRFIQSRNYPSDLVQLISENAAVTLTGI